MTGSLEQQRREFRRKKRREKIQNYGCGGIAFLILYLLLGLAPTIWLVAPKATVTGVVERKSAGSESNRITYSYTYNDHTYRRRADLRWGVFDSIEVGDPIDVRLVRWRPGFSYPMGSTTPVGRIAPFIVVLVGGLVVLWLVRVPLEPVKRMPDDANRTPVPFHVLKCLAKAGPDAPPRPIIEAVLRHHGAEEKKYDLAFNWLLDPQAIRPELLDPPPDRATLDAIGAQLDGSWFDQVLLADRTLAVEYPGYDELPLLEPVTGEFHYYDGIDAVALMQYFSLCLACRLPLPDKPTMDFVAGVEQAFGLWDPEKSASAPVRGVCIDLSNYDDAGTVRLFDEAAEIVRKRRAKMHLTRKQEDAKIDAELAAAGVPRIAERTIRADIDGISPESFSLTPAETAVHIRALLVKLGMRLDLMAAQESRIALRHADGRVARLWGEYHPGSHLLVRLENADELAAPPPRDEVEREQALQQLDQIDRALALRSFGWKAFLGFGLYTFLAAVLGLAADHFGNTLTLTSGREDALLVGMGLTFWMMMAIPVLWMLWRKRTTIANFIGHAIVAAFLILMPGFFTSFAVYSAGNAFLDRSPQVTGLVVVERKLAGYRVETSPWRADGENERFKISGELYRDISVGDHLTLTVSNGGLGIPRVHNVSRVMPTKPEE